MKLSGSLPDGDVRFLDAYASAQHLGSRSAALQRAIRLLSSFELGGAYEAAWAEWEGSGEAAAWEVATADGPGVAGNAV